MRHIHTHAIFSPLGKLEAQVIAVAAPEATEFVDSATLIQTS